MSDAASQNYTHKIGKLWKVCNEAQACQLHFAPRPNYSPSPPLLSSGILATDRLADRPAAVCSRSDSTESYMPWLCIHAGPCSLSQTDLPRRYAAWRPRSSAQRRRLLFHLPPLPFFATRAVQAAPV